MDLSTIDTTTHFHSRGLRAFAADLGLTMVEDRPAPASAIVIDHRFLFEEVERFLGCSADFLTTAEGLIRGTDAEQAYQLADGRVVVVRFGKVAWDAPMLDTVVLMGSRQQYDAARETVEDRGDQHEVRNRPGRWEQL